MASVSNAHAIKHRASRKYGHASITLYRDTPTRRIVEELQLYQSSAVLSMRELFCSAGDAKRYDTYGAETGQQLDARTANAIARRMLADIESAGLVADRSNTAATLHYWPPA